MKGSNRHKLYKWWISGEHLATWAYLTESVSVHAQFGVLTYIGTRWWGHTGLDMNPGKGEHGQT